MQIYTDGKNKYKNRRYGCTLAIVPNLTHLHENETLVE